MPLYFPVIVILFLLSFCHVLIVRISPHSSTGVQRANARADSRTRKTPAATRWEEEKSPRPVRVALRRVRVRGGNDDEDSWNWRIDIDFHMSN